MYNLLGNCLMQIIEVNIFPSFSCLFIVFCWRTSSNLISQPILISLHLAIFGRSAVDGRKLACHGLPTTDPLGTDKRTKRILVEGRHFYVTVCSSVSREKLRFHVITFFFSPSLHSLFYKELIDLFPMQQSF